ncbi:hypothetical protein J6590_057337 [Homalodisca vitripennis]|nr:hypothetical protein J6590_057337 [Homalodisca vitripennis]
MRYFPNRSSPGIDPQQRELDLDSGPVSLIRRATWASLREGDNVKGMGIDRKEMRVTSGQKEYYWLQIKTQRREGSGMPFRQASYTKQTPGLFSSSPSTCLEHKYCSTVIPSIAVLPSQIAVVTHTILERERVKFTNWSSS